MGIEELKKKAFIRHAVMVSAIKEHFDIGGTPTFETPSKKTDLPRWEINGHILFAKDEKTAIKYAKKRGLWVDGTIVKPINTEK